MFGLLFVSIIIATVYSEKIGPYVMEVDAINVCIVTGKATYRVPFKMVLYEEDGKSLLRWNLTLTRRNVPLRANVVMMSVGSNNPKKMLDFDEIACKHYFLKSFLKLSNFDPDQSVDCGMNKGMYYGEKIDPNRLAHLLSRTMLYGDYLVRFVWYFPRGVIACQELRIRAKPIPKKITT